MIGALTRHFRQLWRVRELLDKKMLPADIGRSYLLMHFFWGDYFAGPQFSRRELKRIFEEFYRSDVVSKTGGQPYTLLHGMRWDLHRRVVTADYNSLQR